MINFSRHPTGCRVVWCPSRFLALVFLVGFILPASDAQEHLDLATCLSRAREKNLLLRISAAGIRSAELSQSEFRSSVLPQFKFRTEGTYAPSNSSFGYDPIASNEGETSVQLVVEHTLYDGGVRGIRSDQLSLGLEQSGLLHRATVRDLTLSVQQAFIDVLLGEQEVEVEKQSVDQLRDYYEIVQRLSKGGAANETDILKTQVQLAGAESARRAAIGETAAAKLTLAELFGSTPDTSFVVDGSLTNLVGAEFDTSSRDEPFDASLNLDSRIAAMSVQRSILDVQIAERERYPNVSLFGDAGVLTSVQNLQFPRNERSPYVGYMVGVSLDLPLYTWGAIDARIQEKELAADTVRMQSTLLQRSIQTEIQKTRIRLEASRDHLRTVRSSKSAAEDNYLLTRAKYVGGGTLALEVLNAQQIVADTRRSEIRTLAEIQLLIAKLQQLTLQ